MWFATRVALTLMCCAAMMTLACASDTGDEEVELGSKDAESVSVEPVEGVEMAEAEVADVVPASTDKPAAADHGFTRAEDAAFDFTLKDTDGSYLRLSDYTGKVVLLNFWDTWCAPCRMEIPDLKELHHTYGKDGFLVIGVALARQGEQKVKNFVQSSEITYPVVIASREMLTAYGGVASIPTTFLLGKDQTIHKRYVGLQPKTVLESEIKSLLAEG